MEAALCWAGALLLHSPHRVQRGGIAPVYSRNLRSGVPAVKEVQVQHVVLSAQNRGGSGFLPTLTLRTLLCPGGVSEFKPVPSHRHVATGIAQSMKEPPHPVSLELGG